MDGSDNVAEDPDDRVGTRSRMLSRQLDQEGVLLEKLRRLKNERSGYLSTLTSRRNEIDELLLHSENVQCVKDKVRLPGGTWNISGR